MVRVFKYRGKTLEELQALSMDELVKILPSRVRRSMTRGFRDDQRKLIEIVRKTRKILDAGAEFKVIRTHCRDMPVLPEMVGLTFDIYSGKEFKRVEIQPEMIGHYLGEFAATRQSVKHSAPGIGATRSSLFVPIK